MDSYFGTQEGDFRLELKSILARKRTEDEAANARMGFGKVETDSKVFNEKNKQVSKGGATGWIGWLRERCVVS